MISYPFHPVGIYSGGVSVSQGKVSVFGPSTGYAVATVYLPSETLPGDLYRDGRLFDLFPTTRWYIAKPWEGEVKLELVRLDRERQIDGTATFRGNEGRVDGVYPWTAEVNYSEHGPTWEIDAPLPMQDGILNDYGLRLNLSKHIFSFIGEGVPGRGRPGDSRIFRLHNYFTKDDFFNEQPYLVTRLSSSDVKTIWQMYATELNREIQ